jgi:DNA-binding transcriptional LysR family regulator
MSRDLPPLNALRAFEAAARLQSVSRAAEELHVTHGAVSRQVRVLEEQLGLGLFEKNGRGVKLTAAGLRLRDATSEAFERLRDTCATLRRETEERPFVLGCPGSLLARWFIPRLDRLQRELPELRLQLSASQGELDPRSAEVDATLLFADLPWPADMQVFELAAERIGPVLSPRYGNHAQLAAALPEALYAEPLLHTTSRPQAWPQWAQTQGLAPERLQQGQGFEHLYYLLEAAAAGLGVAIAPQTLVADDLRAGRLVAPWGFVETSGCLALWIRRADPRSERLAHWLRKELAA